MIENFIKDEESQIKNLFTRIKNKDFSGNTGQAIKNSTFQLATSLIAKFGSLLFTIVLAGELLTVKLFGFEKPLLTPELFGLYSLALSTIVMFATFSEIGLGQALTTFLSKSLGEKKYKKAKAYFIQLLKWKLLLVFTASFALLISSYFIANIYYNKPILLALLAGAIYIPITTLTGFLNQAFQSLNLFRYHFYRELILQISRFVLIPLAIFYFLNLNLAPNMLILTIFLMLSFCYFLTFLFLLIISKKKLFFLQYEKEDLTKKERKELISFMIPLIATVLSGVFFGYIDTIMLGHFVEEEFIAFYGVAFALIGAASTIISFAGTALLPIFARLRGKSLEKCFRHTRAATLLISVVAAIFTFFIAKYVILLIYGAEYTQSILLLKIFSILMIVLPISFLYNSYFISQEKTKILAILLISATIINIILNYFFIQYGLILGMYEAVIGACIATIISRTIYLLGLGFVKGFIK